MVCPMKQKDNRPQDRPTEYPYEPLYRPWSWIFSSLCNVFLIAILFLTIYAMYRRSKSKGKRQTTYRTVVTDKSDVLESRGKIKAVVTGGSGSLGGEIVRGLIEDGGYLVHSLDLFIPDTEKRNSDVHTYIQADIGDRDSLRLALKDIEVVFHTAGIIPTYVGHTRQDFHDVIATGTENIVATCKELGVKRLLYTSSVNAMISNDPNQSLIDLDESEPYPETNLEPYGAAKATAEKHVREANSEQLLTCCIRPCGFAEVMNKQLQFCIYFGDGSCQHQVISTNTVAKVHILAEKKLESEGAQSVAAGKAYIIASEDSASIKEFAEYIASLKSTQAWSLPLWALKLLTIVNHCVYWTIGIAPVNRNMRLDMLEFATKSHTYSSQLGKRELQWKDERSWKEIFKELNQEKKKQE